MSKERKEKFIVESYFSYANEVQEVMNEHYKNGYYPKEIQLEPYQDEVIGFVIYELAKGDGNE